MRPPRARRNYFATRFRFDDKREIAWNEIVPYLQRRFIDPRSAILELGPGYGHFINIVRGRERHAVDVTAETASFVAPDVRFRLGSCASLDGLSSDYFDVVFASNLLEHLERSEVVETLDEVWRVLKVGGRIILIQPNFKYCARDYFDDYTHVQVFTHVGLADILAAHGLEPEVVVPKFLPLSMQSRLPVSKMLVWAYLRSPIKPLGAQMLIVARKANRR